MDDSKTATPPAEAGKPDRRTPRTFRFHDSEWARIEAFAESRGLSAAEFVRFAALAAMHDGAPARDRLAPLIERTFRYAHVLATALRDEMLDAGRGGELDALVAEARALQDEALKDRSG